MPNLLEEKYEKIDDRYFIRVDQKLPTKIPGYEKFDLFIRDITGEGATVYDGYTGGAITNKCKNITAAMHEAKAKLDTVLHDEMGILTDVGYTEQEAREETYAKLIIEAVNEHGIGPRYRAREVEDAKKE